MFGLGLSEIVVLGLMALIIIGPEDLPKLARTIGRFLNEVKRGGDSFRHELENSTKKVSDELKVDVELPKINSDKKES